jgi:hypothetical protein
MSFDLVLALASAFAVPCIIYSYEFFPGFTFIIGDLLIFLAFAFLFWPLRRVRLRDKVGESHV